MPGGPRGALVDEVNGDSICDQIPLPHGHGSVNFRFSMIPSSLKFQVSSAPSHAGSFRKKLFPPGRVLPIHGSLKRKRGVGERHKSSRVGACCTSGLLVHAPRCTPTPRSRFRLPARCQGPKNWPTTGLSFRLVAPPAELAPFEKETLQDCRGWRLRRRRYCVSRQTRIGIRLCPSKFACSIFCGLSFRGFRAFRVGKD